MYKQLALAASLSMMACGTTSKMNFPPESKIRECSPEAKNLIAQTQRDLKKSFSKVNWGVAEMYCEKYPSECKRSIGDMREFYAEVLDEATSWNPNDFKCFDTATPGHYPAGWAEGGDTIVFDERCINTPPFTGELLMHESAHIVEQRDGINIDKDEHNLGTDQIYLIGYLAKESIFSLLSKTLSEVISLKTGKTMGEAVQMEGVSVEFIPHCRPR